MNTSKDIIYSNASNLISDLDNLTLEEVEKKYSEFRIDFPKVYDLCLNSDSTTLPNLRLMLKIREEVKTNSKSEIEANVQVSEFFAKKYVYPKTGEPSLERKKEAIQKIMSGKNSI